MSWCFAIVNGRLTELFFDKNKNTVNILGHAHVKLSEYKTKKEKQLIENDTSKFKLAYKNGTYKDLTTGKIYQSVKRLSDWQRNGPEDA